MSNIIPLDYDGHPIRFNEEGWINATDVAAKFGKEPNDWLSKLETLELKWSTKIGYYLSVFPK
ncbi:MULTISPECIES: KilA-N domain-containing protein [Xenorhabdus]|uniref:KilA-N domain-containing protein n=1 Tax=Xenorhabdus TaxID=626 RepID=UPI00068DED6F|nr:MULTISPECIES: KilA-N domain-containing protein [Xenorhabdus]